MNILDVVDIIFSFISKSGLDTSKLLCSENTPLRDFVASVLVSTYSSKVSLRGAIKSITFTTNRVERITSITVQLNSRQGAFVNKTLKVMTGLIPKKIDYTLKGNTFTAYTL